MNLTTEPWIPIVWDDGKPGRVSLTEAFSRGNEIRDLAVRPHERIALMRLLICVTHAALDGPNGYKDWKKCQSRIVPRALKYLYRWKDAFELFGSGQRFLQVGNLKKRKDNNEDNAASKLDFALATGNNPTLFDNAGGSRRNPSTAQLALNLLTFQCFSPAGRIGVASWSGKETPGKGSSKAAPCIVDSMLHALVRGKHLLETIHINLLSRSQVAQLYGNERWGRPLWEQMPDGPVNDQSVHNATETYLGRLVLLSRAVLLDEGGDTMVLANGLKYAPYPAWREPTATVVVRHAKGQPKHTLLRASLDKAPWRELHSLTVKTLSQAGPGGPIALQNVSDDQAFDLWVGGLVADQAKLIDTVESVFHVPAAMLTDPGQRTYEAGVKYAEDIEFRLRRAVGVYHKELGDNLDRAEMRGQRKRVQSKATFQFWTEVEHRVDELLAVAADPTVLGLKMDWHKTDWGRAVWRAALTAFARACPHATPRQLRAYALGLNRLYFKPKEQEEIGS